MFPPRKKNNPPLESYCHFPLDLYYTLPSLGFAFILLNCGLQVAGDVALAFLQRFSNVSGAAPHPSAPASSFSYIIFFLIRESDIIPSGSPEGAKSCPRMSKGCTT